MQCSLWIFSHPVCCRYVYSCMVVFFCQELFHILAGDSHEVALRCRSTMSPIT